jgi:hypothetical protein
VKGYLFRYLFWVVFFFNKKEWILALVIGHTSGNCIRLRSAALGSMGCDSMVVVSGAALFVADIAADASMIPAICMQTNSCRRGRSEQSRSFW